MAGLVKNVIKNTLLGAAVGVALSFVLPALAVSLDVPVGALGNAGWMAGFFGAITGATALLQPVLDNMFGDAPLSRPVAAKEKAPAPDAPARAQAKPLGQPVFSAQFGQDKATGYLSDRGGIRDLLIEYRGPNSSYLAETVEAAVHKACKSAHPPQHYSEYVEECAVESAQNTVSSQGKTVGYRLHTEALCPRKPASEQARRDASELAAMAASALAEIERKAAGAGLLSALIDYKREQRLTEAPAHISAQPLAAGI